MLGLGVLLGSATSQLAQSAGLTSIMLEASPPPPEEEPVEEEEFEAAEPAPETPVVVAEAPVRSAARKNRSKNRLGSPEPNRRRRKNCSKNRKKLLPPVKHVFLIVLGENGYEESFGPTSPAPYLSQDAARTGRAAAQLLRGRHRRPRQPGGADQRPGPDPGNAARLPDLRRHRPRHASPPAARSKARLRLPGDGENAARPADRKEAEVEGLRRGHRQRRRRRPAADLPPPGCSPPPTPAHAPVPGDAYETWRNPFVYFHSLVDDPECAETDVGLDRFALDLKSAKKTPTLSYIVPNACHAGGRPALRAGSRPARWRPKNSSAQWSRRSRDRPPTKKAA